MTVTATVNPPAARIYVQYGPDIETEISLLVKTIGVAAPELAAAYHPRWLAVQLLEGDTALLSQLQNSVGVAVINQALNTGLTRLRALYGDDLDVIMADARYNFVHQLVQQVVTRPAVSAANLSDRLDRVLTHRYWGLPAFLVIMWAVFKITTDVSAPYLDWVDGLITGPITRWGITLLTLAGLGDTWVQSLLVDGIIAGVGGVLVFVPVLMSLYLALAILEDSGYMARAAFVMDRLMSKLGLHGKSFLPLIVGFGCTVPALYATRTLENHRDRVLTGLLVPFMSCGARLPVYVLFAAIFFPGYGGLVIFSIYLTGILTAIGVGLMLRKTLFKSTEALPLLMEIPPYRLPTLKNIWFYVWERTSGFLRNATTVILGASIVIWLLMAIPLTGRGTFARTPLNDSAFAAVAGFMAPAFGPLGFGSWEAGSALMTGLVAKEVVISTMAQVYNAAETAETVEATSFGQDAGQIATSFIEATVDTIKSIPLIIGFNLSETEDNAIQTDLMAAVRQGFETTSGGHGALAGLAFMVFVLLYTPCMASIAAEKQELGARWMWFSIVGQFGLAWLMAWLVFQGGRLLGIG